MNEYLRKEKIYKKVILSFLTLGIYYFIWNFRISKQIKYINNIFVFNPLELICFIIVPYFKIYWFYTKFDRLVLGAKRYNVVLQDKSFLAVIVSIFGLSIINTILLQHYLNKLIDDIELNKLKPNSEPFFKVLTANLEFIDTQNIALSFVLSFITFGIYDLFWLRRIMNKLCYNDNEKYKTLSLFLFYLIPFFNVYLLFKLSELLFNKYRKENIDVNDKSSIAILLGINKLNAICLALFQNDINIK